MDFDAHTLPVALRAHGYRAGWSSVLHGISDEVRNQLTHTLTIHDSGGVARFDELE